MNNRDEILEHEKVMTRANDVRAMPFTVISVNTGKVFSQHLTRDKAESSIIDYIVIFPDVQFVIVRFIEWDKGYP